MLRKTSRRASHRKKRTFFDILPSVVLPKPFQPHQKNKNLSHGVCRKNGTPRGKAFCFLGGRFLWGKLLGRSFPPRPLQELFKKVLGSAVVECSRTVPWLGAKCPLPRTDGLIASFGRSALASDQGPPRPCSLHKSCFMWGCGRSANLSVAKTTSFISIIPKQEGKIKYPKRKIRMCRKSS